MQALLQTFSSLSATDLTGLLTSRTLHFIPRLAKYFVIFLFLVQIRSWPLTWHYRVWKPVFVLRGKFLLLRIANTFRSKEERKKKNLEWLEGLSKVGTNPFDLSIAYKSWAGPDDCDFNLHLSNSSYPKHLDSARFVYALECAPTFLRVGGWLGLGATHFSFLREIPMFSHYEMRTTILSWDHKWMLAVTRYVTKPKGKGKKTPAKPADTAVPSAGTVLSASLHTANGVNTERPEPDGAIVNCIAVSEVVCKIGRITIPPALVYAMDGFCCAPPATAESSGDEKASKAYSRENPPPHWERVRALRGDAHSNASAPSKATLKALRDFYTHGWRDVPEGERWWEQALGGEVEERRLKGLPILQALRQGMEGARAI